MSTRPFNVSARSVSELPGVGPRIAGLLAGLGITRELDLLLHRPLRYEDRTAITPLNRLRPGARTQVEGSIVHQEIRQRRRKSLVLTLADDHGQVILRFFHFYPSQLRVLRTGARLRCYGEVRPGFEGLEMVHPQYQPVSLQNPPPLPDHLSPIYPATAGLAQATLARLIEVALARMENDQFEVPDPLGTFEVSHRHCEERSDEAIQKAGDWIAARPSGARNDEIGITRLPSLTDAIGYLHHPPPDADLLALADGHHPAVQRLAVEELLAHQLAMARLNLARAKQKAYPLRGDESLAQDFIRALPFTLTGAQRRVVGEIGADIESEKPMRRLLQGDVGSGKTAVAAWALLRAAASGRQAALVAPTEILAEQHYQTLSAWFEPLGVSITWLAGKVQGKARKQALAELAGDTSIAVGTHALFQRGVEFADLALVVVDEQHRFGVHQRLALAAKGAEDQRQPHQLVMTATPIPRTLAMTTYAGLEVSVLDELPPGRRPVTTVAISENRRAEVIARIARALDQGRQAYWVCTLIEDSEVLEAEAAQVACDRLVKALPKFRVGLIHGRLKPAEKAAVMADFVAGKIRLLVATTVIEVGVDVPNASLMIVENAERLGLAQLHQLRGRVGRGSEQSACVLMYRSPLSEMARARLEVMRETTDGFVIAEKDLELRGPGEVLGTRQTGMLRFRVADLARDADWLEQVQALAVQLEAGDPAGCEAIIDRWIGQAAQFGDV